MCVKQQRLSEEAGWQANLPEEPPAPSRDQEKHKGCEWGWGDRPTSQSKAGGRSRSWSLGQRTTFKNEFSHLSGEGANQTAAAEGEHSCCLEKIRALTTLQQLAVLPCLTIPTNLVDRNTKYHSQASHLVRPHQIFCL
jgi:hypothetical protein